MIPIQYCYTDYAAESLYHDAKKGRDGFNSKTQGSAGYDVRAHLDAHEAVVAPQTTLLVGTGLKVWSGTDESNPMHYFLMTRSSLFKKTGLILANSIGLIDSDYQGEIMLQLFNIKNVSAHIENGQRIGQVVFANTIMPEMKLVNSFNETTSRGQGGFGSTGDS